MSWIRKLWAGREPTSNTSLDDISASIALLSEAVSESDRGVKKGLRRLSLAQQQQNEVIDTLSRESGLIKSVLVERQGVVLRYPDILQILDDLGKIAKAVNKNEIAASLLARAAGNLLSQSDLKAIAEVSRAYPDDGCEVVGAVEEPQRQAGTVHEILQQGYQTGTGHIVRKAKVIVYQQLKEEINNGL